MVWLAGYSQASAPGFLVNKICISQEPKSSSKTVKVARLAAPSLGNIATVQCENEVADAPCNIAEH